MVHHIVNLVVRLITINFRVFEWIRSTACVTFEPQALFLTNVLQQLINQLVRGLPQIP